MTIHQLAKDLNLSSATVSLALKGDLRIAEATRRRVVEHAGKTGYKVNEQARNLRLGRSGLVALVVNNIASDFWAGAVKSIEDALGEEYSVLICNSGGNLEKERRIVERLLARRIDGLIIQPADNSHVEHLSAPSKAGTPVVLFERNDDVSLSFVKGDDYEAGQRAFKLLRELGHSRIALLSIDIERHIGLSDRKRGFLDAVAEAGHEETCRLYETSEPLEGWINSGFIKDAKGFSGIVCIDDKIIPPLLKAMAAAGLECPRDFSLLCWNKRAMLDFTKPPVSCFEIPVAGMGGAAAEIVLARLSGCAEPVRRLIPEPLILRESISEIKRYGV